MKDIIARINDFLFDFLGLIVPGIVVVLVVLVPLAWLNFGQLPPERPGSFPVFLKNAAESVPAFLEKNQTLGYILFFIATYIAGHAIKVFAKLQYRILESLFDGVLWQMGSWFIHLHPKLTASARALTEMRFVGAVITFLREVFSFALDNYYPVLEHVRQATVAKIREKLDPGFTDDWDALYKLADAVISQENIKSKSYTFLAKYNFYRSLAFLFLANFLYLWWLAGAFANFLPPAFLPTALICNFVLWFTFHEKFKRYWLLCGNEALLAIYYFLFKTTSVMMNDE
jgi:hypothetical protein